MSRKIDIMRKISIFETKRARVPVFCIFYSCSQKFHALQTQIFQADIQWHYSLGTVKLDSFNRMGQPFIAIPTRGHRR